MTEETKEARRIREDQEREKYVNDMMAQLHTIMEREFVRSALNSAWINGRNQILRRSN